MRRVILLLTDLPILVLVTREWQNHRIEQVGVLFGVQISANHNERRRCCASTGPTAQNRALPPRLSGLSCAQVQVRVGPQCPEHHAFVIGNGSLHLPRRNLHLQIVHHHVVRKPAFLCVTKQHGLSILLVILFRCHRLRQWPQFSNLGPMVLLKFV